MSTLLRLTDLDDFLGPSQACIKPINTGESNAASAPQGKAETQTVISIDAQGQYYEEIRASAVKGEGASLSLTGSELARERNRKKLEKAEISLNDCLACSGCVTSAESILITLQSQKEVEDFLLENQKRPPHERKLAVVSIASQSLASLGASLGMTGHDEMCLLWNRLKAFLKGIGFHIVLDTTFARHLSLTEVGQDYLERLEQQEQRDRKASQDQTESSSSTMPSLPLLASSCPGWICYAEKTHGRLLPLVSKVKSPQAMMGKLVKEYLPKLCQKGPGLPQPAPSSADIYHVSIMMCYDKKLEASRQDFYDEVERVRDVDCVLVTSELESMLTDRGIDLRLPIDHWPVDWTSNMDRPSPHEWVEEQIPVLLSHPGSSSDASLSSVIKAYVDARQPLLKPILAETALADPVTSLEQNGFLRKKIIRSSDYTEVSLCMPRITPGGLLVPTDEVVWRGALCFGFRNLQNLVRKLGRDLPADSDALPSRARARTGRARQAALVAARSGSEIASSSKDSQRLYDFVEVMACPSGCVNGGGQLKPEPGSPKRELEDDLAGGESRQGNQWTPKEWIPQVEEAYWNLFQTDEKARNEDPASSRELKAFSDRHLDTVLDRTLTISSSTDGTSHSRSLSSPSTPCSDVEMDLGIAARDGTTGRQRADDLMREIRSIYAADAWKDFCRTEYHAVEKMDINPLAVKW